MAELTTWTVYLDTPDGPCVMDVPSTLGPEAAGRRAIFTAAAVGIADLGEAEITAIVDET